MRSRLRHKRKIKRGFYIVLMVVIVLFLALFFSKLGFLTIKSVIINALNVSCADQETLKKKSEVIGQNFFLLTQKEVEDKLKRNTPCIKNIDLQKKVS